MLKHQAQRLATTLIDAHIDAQVVVTDGTFGVKFTSKMNDNEFAEQHPGATHVLNTATRGITVRTRQVGNETVIY